MEILTYQKIIEKFSKKPRKVSLFMGNGFSVAYDNGIFNYNALAEFLKSSADTDPVVKKLFNLINTNNFELIMRQLDATIEMLHLFDSENKIIEKIEKSSESLKLGLIEAIKNMHPKHVFSVEKEKSICCFDFLSYFLNSGGSLFSTNYDFLLYWVLMRNNSEKNCDGFGVELTNPNYKSEGVDPIYSELIWGPNKDNQNIHYLHGALHIFNGRLDIFKETYDEDNFLLDNVKNRISSKQYPIFVTAGNGKDKLAQIRRNRYLNYCYEKLCSIDGSLVSFGFNFGDYDEHIIDALNKAVAQNFKKPPKLRSIYIGVYSEDDVKHVNSIINKFNVKVNIFDAKTAPVWNNI